jgi:hypothetical protein
MVETYAEVRSGWADFYPADFHADEDFEKIEMSYLRLEDRAATPPLDAKGPIAGYPASAMRASFLIRSTMERTPLLRWGVRCWARPSSVKSGMASRLRISSAGRPE